MDDEPKNLTVLETVLDDPGYRLVRAESADQALLALVVEEFALLILDIRMPGMTGFELAQMIKERKKTARVPIIFLTAYYNEDQHVLEGYGTGAVDYLHKPVNPAILRSKVAVFAELHRKSRECEMANRALLAEVTERRRAEGGVEIHDGEADPGPRRGARRIARELHDDFNQRLAALSVELASIERSSGRPPLSRSCGNSRRFVFRSCSSPMICTIWRTSCILRCSSTLAWRSPCETMSPSSRNGPGCP